ncbi:MAG: lantibiotic dehydratase, partial [Kofleriaceae bacterium]
RLRYAVARLEGKVRRYQLDAVAPTPYLEATLARARSGARIAELASALADDEITLDDAREFVLELIDSQLLVPDLGIHITGVDPIQGMVEQLRAARAEVATPLAEVAAAIQALDADGLGNAPARYQTIASALEPLPVKVDLGRLFQVDMAKPAVLTLGNRVIADVDRAVELLAKVCGRDGDPFATFRRAFSDRWADQEVSLAEVLDEESGIGFEVNRSPGAEGSPLLANIAFPAARGDDRGPAPTRFEALLRRKVMDALAQGAEAIELAEPELAKLAADAPARLPDAYCAMIRIAATPDELARGDVSVMFEGIAGPSGARLLGRFCHVSAEIEAIVRAHHAREEALAPHAIFAEIVHLNEGRIGNIVCRPVLRGHELTFLGMSGAPRDHQLEVSDLLVAVRGDRIVLRSRSLGKEIVPRLTTAHNFRLRSLGTYRFLAALATQQLDLPRFSWGALGSQPFLPRVKVGRIVLARAIWNLGESDLAPITAATKERDPARVTAAIAALRAHRKLPRWVVLAEGDNELAIDLENPLMVATFADELAGKTFARLTELFPAPDRLVVRGPEGGFASELVVMFTRDGAAAVEPRPEPAAPRIRRLFPPGSEWLYAKIYCGEATADRVLTETIGPLVREALAAGEIDRWFFLRYQDPDGHLRVRFHGDPARLLSAVIPRLDRALAPLLADRIVHKLVLDTYDRELERYGGDRAIELVEEIFWRDSEAVVAIFDAFDGSALDLRWRVALRGIESLLVTLGLSAEQRAQIYASSRESIGAEYGAVTATWGTVGDKFTKERASLDQLFVAEPERDAAHELAPCFEALAVRDAALAGAVAELVARERAGELTRSIGEFAWSLVHMHANRMLHASARAQEMVLYDFLRRLHAAKKARGRA